MYIPFRWGGCSLYQPVVVLVGSLLQLAHGAGEAPSEYSLLLSGSNGLQTVPLVFEDDFNEGTLDSSKWTHEVDCWGGGNQEAQCYTSDPQNSFTTTLEDGSGVLVIKAIQSEDLGGFKLPDAELCTHPQPAQFCDGATKPFSSARLTTAHAFAMRYGAVEIRARLPRGPFLWPALWMLPAQDVYGTWAASGEIDIMESRGQNPEIVSGALHYGGMWPYNSYTSDMAYHVSDGDQILPFSEDEMTTYATSNDEIGDSFATDFHSFTLEWEPKQIRWYADGQLFFSKSLDDDFTSSSAPCTPYSEKGQPFDQHFYLILNLAVGGTFFPGNLYGTFSSQADYDTAVEQWTKATLEIDYVRAWSSDVLAAVALSAPKPVPVPCVPVSLQYVKVTFQVDMGCFEGPAYTGVFVNGEFNNWCGSCWAMDQVEGTDVWQITAELEYGTYEYIFTTDGWDGTSGTVPQGSTCDWNPADVYANLGIALSEDTTTNGYKVVDLVAFGQCETCDALSDTPLQAIDHASPPPVDPNIQADEWAVSPPGIDEESDSTPNTSVPAACASVLGDLNNSGTLDIFDIVLLVNLVSNGA